MGNEADIQTRKERLRRLLTALGGVLYVDLDKVAPDAFDCLEQLAQRVRCFEYASEQKTNDWKARAEKAEAKLKKVRYWAERHQGVQGLWKVLDDKV